MTLEELEADTQDCFEVIKAKCLEEGDFKRFFAFHLGDKWHIEKMEKLKQFMDNGAAKELIFSSMRVYIEAMGADAVLFPTESWFATPTKLGSQYRWEDLLLGIDKGYKTLTEMGLVKREERIVAIGQTPEHAVMVAEPFERLGLKMMFFEKPYTFKIEQSTYGGRTKMFGRVDDDMIEPYQLTKQYMAESGFLEWVTNRRKEWS